jgi:hypothetical protein
MGEHTMKKLLVATAYFFFCLAPLAVSAENGAVDKGSFELGVGNILDIWLYRSDNYENVNWIGIGMTPDLTFGYFMANRLMIGTTIGLTTTKYESATESDNTFFIQPVLKYYFPVSEKFLFNLKGFFGWERDKYEGDPDTYTRSRFGGGHLFASSQPGRLLRSGFHHISGPKSQRHGSRRYELLCCRFLTRAECLSLTFSA